MLLFSYKGFCCCGGTDLVLVLSTACSRSHMLKLMQEEWNTQFRYSWKTLSTDLIPWFACHNHVFKGPTEQLFPLLNYGVWKRSWRSWLRMTLWRVVFIFDSHEKKEKFKLCPQVHNNSSSSQEDEVPAVQKAIEVRDNQDVVDNDRQRDHNPCIGEQKQEES